MLICNKKRRAVAPLIATLLLVAVAVVGGIVTFVWASGMFGTTAGIGLPSVESIQLVGYDTRDTTDLTGFGILDNTSDQKLTGDGTNGEFIVLKVRNTGMTDLSVDSVVIMGLSHTWDSSANTTTAPTIGKFEVYQKLEGDPSSDKTAPVVAAGEDARIAIRLGNIPGDEIKLGKNIPVKIKTGQGTAFNFSLLIGESSGLSTQSSQGGSQNQNQNQSQTCNGQTATIVGTAGDDNIQGTNGDDVIVGLGGNDTINGANGNDVVCGGDGIDDLKGGPGDDMVFGEAGDDDLKGEAGDDQLNGGSGTDTCKGDSGNDTFTDCETEIQN